MGTPCTRWLRATGGGGSKTPTANHRRPLPFGKRLCGQTLGPCLVKLSDHVFPQPLWKLFGEHLGEEDGEDQEEEEEASWEPLGALLGPPGSFLGASWRPLGGLLGASWKVLAASFGPLGPS